MSKEFTDIEIIGIDDRTSSHPDPSNTLFDIVLNLSMSAPYEWANCFNTKWKRNFYMMKGKASISGNKLTIHCDPEELKKKHLPELNKVIMETNQWFRNYLISEMAKEKRILNEKEADKAKLKALKDNLKLD